MEREKAEQAGKQESVFVSFKKGILWEKAEGSNPTAFFKSTAPPNVEAKFYIGA